MILDQAITSAVQSLYTLGGGFMDFFFLALTFLAEESFLMVVVFLIYWCINKRLGEYLMLSLFTSLAANGFLKDLIRRPRPFLTEGYTVRYLAVDNGLVNTLSLGQSYSFPSGHSQCAGSIWTALALWFKKAWFWVAAVLLILGVMLSRIYLGVHFPSDVLVGALLGVTSSLLCWWLFNRFYEQRVWLFAAVVAVLLPALFFSPSSDTVKAIGVGVGAVAGMFWEHNKIQFTTEDLSLGKLLLRFLLGGGLALTLKVLLKVVFPEMLLFDGIRYGVVGLTATGLVPWLFVKLKL